MPKNHIILIYPEPRLDDNFPHGTGHPYSITPPINLLSIAQFLVKAGYSCEIIDCKIEDFRDGRYDEALCVGISTMSGVQLCNSVSVAEYVRSNYPHIPLVWGGVHPSLVPESTAAHRLVDYVVRGEGEDAMVELADHIRDGKDPGQIVGISYKKADGTVRHNPDRDFMDMDRIGILPYDLINVEGYPLSKTGFPLNTSRGCPYKCKFCYNLTYNKRKWRSQSPEKVIAAVKHIVDEYGIRNFQFQVDDEFFINKKRVETICTAFIEEGLNIEWTSFNRADHLARYSDEFMVMLEKSGCKEIYIGGESGSERMLKYIEKEIDPDDLIDASIKCSDHGIVPIISFMTAFPGETKKDRSETLKLIDRIAGANPDAIINGIFSYSPYPGTPLFETAREHGLRELETLDDWKNFKYNDVRNIPWLTGREKSELFTLCRLVRFPFLSNSPRFPYALRYRGPGSLLKITVERAAYLLLWMSSRVRWKLKLFSFAPEWKLWGWYALKNNVW